MGLESFPAPIPGSVLHRRVRKSDYGTKQVGTRFGLFQYVIYRIFSLRFGGAFRKCLDQARAGVRIELPAPAGRDARAPTVHHPLLASLGNYENVGNEPFRALDNDRAGGRALRAWRCGERGARGVFVEKDDGVVVPVNDVMGIVGIAGKHFADEAGSGGDAFDICLLIKGFGLGHVFS
jgi:hypothetical protein